MGFRDELLTAGPDVASGLSDAPEAPRPSSPPPSDLRAEAKPPEMPSAGLRGEPPAAPPPAGLREAPAPVRTSEPPMPPGLGQSAPPPVPPPSELGSATPPTPNNADGLVALTAAVEKLAKASREEGRELPRRPTMLPPKVYRPFPQRRQED